MPVDYINLDRSFIPIKEGEEQRLGWTNEQGRRYGGWLDWQALLKHQRVVLLAEAGCGKTAEFRHQAQSLRDAGQAAFFARVEDLEDGIFSALDIGTSADFTAWKDGNGNGLFFLDSVDEARLSRKRFDKALRRLARDIGEPALSRAHIFVSCRVSDWRGDEDRAIFQEKLPLPDPALAAVTPPPFPDWKATLLAPFDEGYQSPQRNSKKLDQATQKDPALLVVQLVPLDMAQQRTFIQRYGVQNIDDFMDSLRRKQLEPLTERPRDLRFLVDHWNRHGTFASLSEMLEEAIKLRLSEINPERRNQDTLPDEKARKGAERLAAGLVLGQRFTLRSPAQDDGPTPNTDSIDATALLPDWSSVELNNLLARGLFAPATYGRIRFYHRWAQEYLTACWLRRLLEKPGNSTAVRKMLFAQRYGVECSIPILRPVTAWLALWDDDIRAELIRLTPLALIQHGDPTALPLKDRAELLRAAARLHADGRIADDGINSRDLALFADQKLAPVIREVWRTNPRERFTFILLRLIQEATIKECADILLAVALNDDAHPESRSVAIEALVACDDRHAIEQVLTSLMSTATILPARVSAALADSFFPEYMSIDQLLRLIDDAPKSERISGNLETMLPEIFNACPDLETKLKFAEGISQLCLAPPLLDGYYRVSNKHAGIAQRLNPIARGLIKALDGKHHPALSAVMSVIRRSRQQDRLHDEKPYVPIGAVLTDYPDLKQELFWEAAAEEAEEGGAGREPTWVAQIEHSFEFGTKDLAPFLEAVSTKPQLWQRRLALNAVLGILKENNRLDAEVEGLRSSVAGTSALEQDLNDYLTPPSPRREERVRTARRHIRQKAETRRQGKIKSSWVGFRNRLAREPQKFCDPSALSGWGSSASDLWNLTKWLERHTREAKENAVLEWRSLADAFGEAVANSFKAGMGILWRSAAPDRSRNKITLMSYAAIGIEAKDNPEWARTLTEADARRAAEHACLSEDHCPFWFDDLLAAHPNAVGPLLAAEIERELQSPAQFGKHFLSHYDRSGQAPVPIVVSTVLAFLENSEPASISAYDNALAIISESTTALSQAKTLHAVTSARLEGCEDGKLSLRHIALLFMLMPDSGVELMDQWIKGSGGSSTERAAQLFSNLFDPHHRNVATHPLAGLSTPCLEALLSLVYRKIRPEADAVHEGVYSPDARDNAETARNSILKALLYRPGPEAHAALLRVGKTLSPNSRLRFLELAHEKAERDSNPEPWTPAEVIKFEEKALLPAGNGDELLDLIVGILEEINFGLAHNDASSCEALRNCPDEDAVQGWLVEQLTLRAHGRYSATQETIAAGRNRMDVLVKAANMRDELVIEIKHGGKVRSSAQLRDALEMQLSGGYLRPATRRHGILVVTNHKQGKYWQHPESKARITLPGLISWLQECAEEKMREPGYGRTLRAVGLDAAPPARGAASQGRSTKPARDGKAKKGPKAATKP